MKRIVIYLSILIAIVTSCRSIGHLDKTNNNKALYPPLMGWASWNNYRVNISEEIIKSQTDALVKHKLHSYGYNYVNIDDGFFGGRDASGNIISHKERFQNGMRHMADYIHSKGLKAGIYSDAGINTCASFWDKDTIGVGMGLYGHDVQDLNLYLKEWNFDFLKVDWCGGQWLGLNEQKRYTEIGRLARQIKPSVNYNVCRWEFPGEWVTEVANSWRISADIANKFNSVLKIIDINADLWQYASFGHYNDMDMLQVGRGMTYEEDKAHFSMWCLMHSPLLLGNDLTTISEETLGIITNKNLIDINQSEFVYQARRLIDNGEMEVWGKPLVSTMSGQVAVALLNRTKEKQTISFNLATVGINAQKRYSTKDLWTNEVSPSISDVTLSFQVPAHGIVVLKITGESLPYNVYQFKDKK